MSKSNSTDFVRYLARVLIGEEVLKTSTITGESTRRKSVDGSEKKKKNKICPNKVAAIKGKKHLI